LCLMAGGLDREDAWVGEGRLGVRVSGGVRHAQAPEVRRVHCFLFDAHLELGLHYFLRLVAVRFR